MENQKSIKRDRHSIRLKDYDYTQPGAYFVTIVAQDHLCLFGEVDDREMRLNEIGQIAQSEWKRLPRRFPQIELGAFVVMPNHIHGIIIINESRRGTAMNPNGPSIDETRRAPTGKTEQFGKPVSGSIPTIIRSYKSSVAFRHNWISKEMGKSIWQRNYFEHVIRNDQELERIHNYILTNPQNWSDDHENPRRVS